MKDYYEDSEMTDVADMYEQFWNNTQCVPTILNREDMLSRAFLIQEELDELCSAAMVGDFYEQIDALIDMVVLIKGTAAMMGIPWREHWDEVHQRNLTKRVGVNSRRAHAPFDLIKPADWVEPDHQKIIRKYVDWL